jgi:hypothetical protein
MACCALRSHPALPSGEILRKPPGVKCYRAIPAADREMPALPSSIAPMIGAITGLILLVLLLGVLFYCAQMLLPLIPLAEPLRTILQVLIILLVAIVALYVIVVLLGFVGIHVPVPGVR